MLSDFILPIIAYLITLLVLWGTVVVTKLVATRVSMPAESPPIMPRMMVGTRTR